MSDYGVTFDALLADSRTWRGWSDRLEALADGVPWVLSQDVYGFFPGVAGVFEGVQQGITTLDAYIRSGGEEFTAISEALVKSAAVYERADQELRADVGRFGARMGFS